MNKIIASISTGVATKDYLLLVGGWGIVSSPPNNR